MSELNVEKLGNVSGGSYKDSFSYQVQSGDSISYLAKRFRTTERHILDLNPQIGEKKEVKFGDWIQMPYPEN